MLLVVKITVLYSMQNSVVGFERLKDAYSQYPDFDIIYKEFLDNLSPTQGDFLLGRGIFLKVLCCLLYTSPSPRDS